MLGSATVALKTNADQGREQTLNGSVHVDVGSGGGEATAEEDKAHIDRKISTIGDN